MARVGGSRWLCNQRGTRADLGLSRREQEMVELLRLRLTNKEMASRLGLSEQTIKNHVHHVLQKLGAPNRFTIVERCENRMRREVPSAPQPVLLVE